jgi:hypothetical protein
LPKNPLASLEARTPSHLSTLTRDEACEPAIRDAVETHAVPATIALASRAEAERVGTKNYSRVESHCFRDFFFSFDEILGLGRRPPEELLVTAAVGGSETLVGDPPEMKITWRSSASHAMRRNCGADARELDAMVDGDVIDILLNRCGCCARAVTHLLPRVTITDTKEIKIVSLRGTKNSTSMLSHAYFSRRNKEGIDFLESISKAQHRHKSTRYAHSSEEKKKKGICCHLKAFDIWQCCCSQ